MAAQDARAAWLHTWIGARLLHSRMGLAFGLNLMRIKGLWLRNATEKDFQ